jgi:hypothetical protein
MIEVRDAQDFHRLATRIGKLDNEVKKEMRRKFTKIAKPVVVEVKAAALSLPSGRGKSDIKVKRGSPVGLRSAISRSVGSRSTTTRKGAGLHIRVSTKRFLTLFPQGNRKIPYYVEGRIKRGWKHPVFGQNMDKPENWPIQKPTPFLTVTAKKHKQEMAKEVNEAFTDALTKVGIVFK